MDIQVFINDRNGNYNATGRYKGNELFVCAGGYIRMDFAEHIRGGKKSLTYRNNPEYVDSEGKILKDCVFTSPSTAAQFVTGRSCNGYESWKVERRKSLGKYLEENGLR